jgi:HSP20 family protein
MAFDLMPRPSELLPGSLWRFPSLLDDPDWNVSSLSGLSIWEDEKQIHVEAPIAGIDPKDVEVTFEHGMLRIKGEARAESGDEQTRYWRRAQRSFAYQVAVPGRIDESAEPEASYENGLVRISFAKVPEVEPKRIQIKAKNK